MAEITINGVKYTNVPNKKAGTKFAASLTQSNIGASQAVQDYVNSAYFYPLVNAIDINWNGVEVEENSYINTTSDLISYIASKESNIDLSSYATMAYVDQKITDLIGGAPETLDTLKELADALAEDASLAYVTQALDGKADKSSLTNYATNSYVTTELDKKANKSDIVQADMCETDSTSKSYVLNNPYKYHLYNLYGTKYYCYNLIIPHNTIFDNTNILDSNIRNCVIIGNNHNIYNNLQYGLIQGYKNKIQNDHEVAFGQYNSSTHSSDNSIRTVFSIGNGTLTTRHNALEVKGDGKIYIADTKNGTPYILQTKLNGKADLSYVTTELDKKANKSEIPSMPDLTPYVSYEQANSYYAYKSDIPDMTNYVSVSSYNALAARVEELASWIVSYHSTPEPEPITGEFAFGWGDLRMNVGDVLTPPLTNTYAYDSITYNSDNPSVFTVDPTGACTGMGNGNANLTAQLYNNTTGEFITETSIPVIVSGGKEYPMPTGWTYDGQILTDLIFVIGDSTSTPTTYAFTATPSDGWEFATTMDQPINGVSIDSTTYNITVTPSLLDTTGQWNMHVERQEDSQYYRGEENVPFVVLAEGSDPTFIFNTTEMSISNEEGTTTKQLWDSKGEVGMYTPTVTSSDDNVVTATVDPNMNSDIIISFVNEGTATVTATITNPTTGVTRTATLTVHAVVNREWIDAHLVNISNDDNADSYYGLPKNSGTMILNFIANRAYGREPLIGFNTTVVGDTNNAIYISHSESTEGYNGAFGIHVDTSKLANMNDFDVIEIQIERAQDSTTSAYSDQRYLRVIPQGADPGLYWDENSLNFVVGTYYGEGQDIIYNRLINSLGDTPTITIADTTIAHMDGNTLYGDSVGTTTITATVTDGNNTRTATTTVNVLAS